VPWVRAAPTSGKHSETSLQPPGQLCRSHRGHPRRRQFDRQRYPIQTTHDGGDLRRILIGHCEIGLDRVRPLGEQPHCLRLGDRGQIGVGVGHSQSRHRYQPLPLDAQALTAGGQDHQPLTRPL
jgi:hypothetical protein